MENYKVPASEGEDQLIEKKSRFIGHIYKVETAEEANNIIAAQKKKILGRKYSCLRISS